MASSAGKRYKQDATAQEAEVEEVSNKTSVMSSSSVTEEVKEVEWVLVSGGSMVGSMRKHCTITYKGRGTVEHELKLPMKDLTLNVVFDEVRRILDLSSSDENESFKLSYIYHPGPRVKTIVLDLMSWNQRPFEIFLDDVAEGRVQKPVKLYHTPMVRKGLYWTLKNV